MLNGVKFNLKKGEIIIFGSHHVHNIPTRNGRKTLTFWVKCFGLQNEDDMNDLKFTTAGEYIDDIDEYNKENGRQTVERIGVTGGETWQTKANKAVPRYYSPVELLSMRVDRLEQELKTLKKELNHE